MRHIKTELKHTHNSGGKHNTSMAQHGIVYQLRSSEDFPWKALIEKLKFYGKHSLRLRSHHCSTETSQSKHSILFETE
jgi:hypothetical protein